MKYTKGQKIIIKKPKNTKAWNDVDMSKYVGREAIITSDEVLDYPGFGEYVHIDVDDGCYMWFIGMFDLKQEIYEIY